MCTYAVDFKIITIMSTTFQYAVCALCIALPFMIAFSESVKKHVKHLKHFARRNAKQQPYNEEGYIMIDNVTGQSFLVEDYFDRDSTTGQLVYEQEIAYIPLHPVEK